MRTTATLLTIAALLSAPAFAQVDRVLHFTEAGSDQEIQEIVAVIRSITEIPQANLDIPEKSLSLSGTASQVALGEWLFANLDKPTEAASRSQGTNFERPTTRMTSCGSSTLRTRKFPRACRKL